MRRQRRISEFGFAEFLGASFHDASQSARQSLAALPFGCDHSLWGNTYLSMDQSGGLAGAALKGIVEDNENLGYQRRQFLSEIPAH